MTILTVKYINNHSAWSVYEKAVWLADSVACPEREDVVRSIPQSTQIRSLRNLLHILGREGRLISLNLTDFANT